MIRNTFKILGFGYRLIHHPKPVFLRMTGCRVAIGDVKSYFPVVGTRQLGNTLFGVFCDSSSHYKSIRDGPNCSADQRQFQKNSASAQKVLMLP